MRIVVRTLIALGFAGLLGAVLVVWLGLYNVSARVGHLPGVSWVLHTAYRNAIKLRAPPPSAVPDLTPDMAALGARHFESACAFCHARAGTQRSATARAMLPEPPHVTEAIADWEPRHLFEILRGGVKMSGMPHWPARRDDEVWAVVAYLETVRSGRAPKAPTGVQGPDPLPYCAGCHGETGQSGNTHIPRLDILSQSYMTETLMAYREGRRPSGFMEHAASTVSEADLREMARYFAESQPAPSETSKPLDTGLGAELAAKGSDDVPACTACHGRKDPYPVIAGQSRDYLATQLKLWRDGTRGGAPRQALMSKAAANLTDAQIDALADYFAGLPAAR